LPVVTEFPLPLNDLERLSKYIGGQAFALVGLDAQNPIALDGLVSLWQASVSK
jgi:hypothetical protein